MAGLAETTRSQFIDLAWGSQLKDLLKEQGLSTRNLFEISSATTQCTNVIGKCDDNSCMCWICGTPIYLTKNGKQWSAAQLKLYNESGIRGTRKSLINQLLSSYPEIKNILPQCEHILPVMQAFLILGGLYWSETIDREDTAFRKLLEKEYAWSHAYCNNVKDEFNFFNDNGKVRREMIGKMLTQIYEHVEPIRNYLLRTGKTTKSNIDEWVGGQIDAMTTTYLDPLIEEYLKASQHGLSILASVSGPIKHVRDLPKELPPSDKRVGVLEKWRPESIPITEPTAESTPGMSEQRLPMDFAALLDKELKMNFLKDLIKQLYNSAGNRKEKGIVNKFIMDLLNQRKYLDENVLSRSNFNNNIDAWYNVFFHTQLMPISNLQDIFKLVNSDSVTSNREAYMLTIVQTLALLKLLERIDPRLKPKKGVVDIYNNLRIVNETTGLLTPFLNDIREYFATAVILLINNESFVKNLNLTQFILGNFSTDRERAAGRYSPFFPIWEKLFPPTKSDSKTAAIASKLGSISGVDLKEFNEILQSTSPPPQAPPPPPPKPSVQAQEKAEAEEEAQEKAEETTRINVGLLIKALEGPTDGAGAGTTDDAGAGTTDGAGTGPTDGAGAGGRKKTRKRKNKRKTRRYKKKPRRQTLKMKRIKKRRTVKK